MNAAVASTARRLLSLASLALLTAFLTACGSTPATDVLPDDTITGVVRAPEGHDVEGTEVQACVEAECSTVTITESGREAPFTFEDMTEEAYTLAAFKAIDDSTFLAGCHGTGEGVACTPTDVSPPREGVTIEMQVVELSAPPEPPAGE